MNRALPLFRETPSYPEGPGTKRRGGTSEAAALSLVPAAGTLRCRIFDAFLYYGPMTADECAGVLGLSPLTVRPRCSELKSIGLVVDTGKRRANESRRKAEVLAP